MTTTKSQVRSDFSYARFLMQQADKMLKDKTITDFSEASEIGQIANELIASVGTLYEYLVEKRES
jgi:hypothetical protein